MARYIKILIDRGSNEWHNGVLTIVEISVYDKENKNIARSKPVQVSSVYQNQGSAITNGSWNFGGDWASAEETGLKPAGKEWVKIDLQENYYITKIVLSTRYERGYGAIMDYRVMFSNNDKIYNLAAQVKNTIVNSRTDTITDIKNNMGCYLYLKDNAIYGMKSAEPQFQ